MEGAALNSRKLIVSMNVTLDGFMSDSDCGLDWHFRYWSTEMAECLSEQLMVADTILLGRKTYLAMAQHWGSGRDSSGIPLEDRAFTQLMNSHRKVVISATIAQLPWANSIKITENLEQEINALKHAPGLNIIVYGSVQLTHSLINSGFVDEFHLWVHPLVLEEGNLLFTDRSEFDKLELIEKKTFRSGVEAMFYRYRL